MVSTKKRKRYNKKQTKKIGAVEVLTPKQILAIDKIANSRDKAICVFLLATGLRISECSELNYGDVFLDIRAKQVKDSIIFIGKGNKQRVVYLTDTAKQAVKDLDRYNRNFLKITKVSQSTPILISRQNGRLTVRKIQLMIKEQIGATPHVFRHTCFTLMRERGVDPIAIQMAAGHSNYGTTVKYYLSVNTEELKAAFAAVETKNESKLRLVEKGA